MPTLGLLCVTNPESKGMFCVKRFDSHVQSWKHEAGHCTLRHVTHELGHQSSWHHVACNAHLDSAVSWHSMHVSHFESGTSLHCQVCCFACFSDKYIGPLLTSEGKQERARSTDLGDWLEVLSRAWSLDLDTAPHRTFRYDTHKLGYNFYILNLLHCIFIRT